MTDKIAFTSLLGLLGLALPAFPAEPQAAPRPILTLDQALVAAGSHQPQLQASAATTLAAQARSDEALAALRPQVSGVGTYQRATANFVNRPGALLRSQRLLPALRLRADPEPLALRASELRLATRYRAGHREPGALRRAHRLLPGPRRT
jgi:outer membrane protein TolC